MNRRDFIKGGIVAGTMCAFPAFASGVTSTESQIHFVDDFKSDQDIIEEAIHDILMKYIFESNDSMTRRDISVEINNYLNGLASIQNYDVVCDSQNNGPDVIQRNTLRVYVFLLPKKPAIQVTRLNFVVGISGVSIDTLE